MSAQTEYWTRHFAQCADSGDIAMDSARSLMVSMYGFVLHLSGPAALDGTILDAGCGAGLLSDAFAGLGARVTGLDGRYVIEKNRTRSSNVSWVPADLEDEWSNLGRYDVVICLESLQFVDVSVVLPKLWSHVANKGRLLFTMPNLDNWINAEGHREHQGMFGGVRHHELNALVRTSCAGYEKIDVFGLHLGTDQRIEAYDSARLHEIKSPSPYRFLVAALKP